MALNADRLYVRFMINHPIAHVRPLSKRCNGMRIYWPIINGYGSRRLILNVAIKNISIKYATIEHPQIEDHINRILILPDNSNPTATANAFGNNITIAEITLSANIRREKTDKHSVVAIS